MCHFRRRLAAFRGPPSLPSPHWWGRGRVGVQQVLISLTILGFLPTGFAYAEGARPETALYRKIKAYLDSVSAEKVERLAKTMSTWA